MRRSYRGLIEEVTGLLEQDEAPSQGQDSHVAQALHRMSRLAQQQTKSADIAGTNSARKTAVGAHAAVADAAAAQGAEDMAGFHDQEADKQQGKVRSARGGKKAWVAKPQPDTTSAPIKQ